MRRGVKPMMARVVDGWAVCPVCGAKLCRVYYGASAHGIELYCRSSGCRGPRLLELK